MKLRVTVRLWSLLLLCALTESKSNQCEETCEIELLPEITTTTTTIIITSPSEPNCTHSVEDGTSPSNSTSGLTPGAVHQLFFPCFNCCLNVTTKPETVTALAANPTTSSIFVTWTKPEGGALHYTVSWRNGESENSERVNQTFLNITHLAAGTGYHIHVTAVAADGVTEGQPAALLSYTKPTGVQDLSVLFTNTSCISLSWAPLLSQDVQYKVEWHCGGSPLVRFTKKMSVVLSGLIPGTEYSLSVSAVAGDNRTEGALTTILSYTNPEEVRNVTVTDFTTSAVSLQWLEPEGNVSFYRVQWNNHSLTLTAAVNHTHVTLSQLTPGIQYNFTVITVAGDKETSGEVKRQFTLPSRVRDLHIAQSTTSSLTVMWTKPEGHADYYKIQCDTGDEVFANSTVETSFSFKALTAGSQYRLSVSAAIHGLAKEGAGSTLVTYTRPSRPENIEVAERGTEHLRISWTLPEGGVHHFIVTISNANLTLQSAKTSLPTVLFAGLYPGRTFELTVAAVAGGNFTNVSEPAFHATFPTPPGSIVLVWRSNSSLQFNWTTPAMMEHVPNISYIIMYQHEGGGVQRKYSDENNAELSGLTSGTSYNLTVRTVGSLSLQSSAVHDSFFTLPNPVSDLAAHPRSTTSVTVTWSYPLGVQSYYQYSVQSFNATGGFVHSTTISSNSTDVLGLEPGSRYDFRVVTIAAPGSESSVKHTFSFTMPQPVSGLRVNYVNTTEVQLMWRKQDDYKPSYSYLVMALHHGVLVQNDTTEEEAYTFRWLEAGTQYRFQVFTVVEDVRSTVESIESITSPESVAQVTVIGSTTNLSVSWSLVSGRVSSYSVLLYRDEVLVKSNTDLSNLTSQTQFDGLSPGVDYCVVLTTRSGPLDSSSSRICNATFPNPPGSVTVESQTTNSINFTWSLPEDMDHQQYNFSVSGPSFSLPTANTWFLLDSLQSGSPYRISVVTVGVRNYESENRTAENFTRPYPVADLQQTDITVNTVTLTWDQPEPKLSYSYLLLATNNSATVSFTVATTNATITGLESGSNISFSVITQAADGTPAEPVTVSYFTRPYGVTQLEAETLSTSAVRLHWMKPLEYKDSYTYWIEVTGCGNSYRNVTEGTTEVHELLPGSNCTFCVSVNVANVIQSEENCISQYTSPESVAQVTVIGSTTNLSVSWSLVSGRVSSYSVLLYRDEVLVKSNTDLSNLTSQTQFDGLSPGVDYCVVLTTRSGPLDSSSSRICNATFPNPPGSVTVESQTTNSINFTWSLPEDMDHQQYNFSVSGPSFSLPTANTWFLLDSLQSGSPYRISVVTVGVRNYESENRTAENFTRPYPVADLQQTDITVNTVTLTWDQPEPKLSYSYLLLATNNSATVSFTVATTNATITGLESGSNISFSVITQAADGTPAEPVTVSYFTRPYGVTQLEAETLSTSAVRLHWMKPLEYKDSYTYWIEVTGCGNSYRNVTEGTTEVDELLPGSNCTFCVSVDVANVIQSEENCISQYTKPEAVQPTVSNQDSNSTIRVMWTKPSGNVDYYKVYLNSSSSVDLSSDELPSNRTSFLFTGLSAGTLYSAMLAAGSGPFRALSGYITNATYPNPPGPVEILSQTSRSIETRWTEPPLMGGAMFFYLLTYQPALGGNITTITTTNTSQSFDFLPSGTSFNISVSTVGALDLKSEPVVWNMVTTRPLSVQSLMTTADESSIAVFWTKPAEHKDSYWYSVSWQRSNEGNSGSVRVNATEFIIDELIPGSSYNLSVTTETFDGTQAEAVWMLNCTRASPVGSLACDGPNKAEAEVILTWLQPFGQHTGLQFVINGGEMIRSIDTCCNYTVSGLHHHTGYQVTVQTESCGEPSKPVSLQCRTGITNPPIPPTYKSKVLVRDHQAHDKFSLVIDPSLLNNTNGPVTHVGVLVTGHSPDESTDLRKYLRNTYDEWKAKNTRAYLATVTNTSSILQSRSDHDLVIEIGTGDQWNAYYNGALEANQIYRCAIALFSDLNMHENLVDSTRSLVSVTNFAFVAKLPVNPAVIGIAVGATLGIFSLLFIVLIGFIIYWRSFSKESPDIEIHSLRAKAYLSVKVEDYEAHFRKQKANSNCGFAEEFEEDSSTAAAESTGTTIQESVTQELKPVGTAQLKTHALTLENKPKNRYNNVLPYDSSRVKLSHVSGTPNDDYINANYMPGYNSKMEFIAAQGPLPTTVNEFWRMIWEKNVQTVVMLTHCNEQGRVKCEQYWSTGTRHFEDITVTTTSEIPLEDWTIRDFKAKNVKTSETRSIRHFHFTSWPDHGTPETTEVLISFRHLVREHMNQYSRHSPTVVHCSAGVGRTGTFIAIDHTIFQIERENIVDIYSIVYNLRMHRPLMIQTEEQYVFLNQCALDIIRSRTGTNVDLIYQNIAALSIYENLQPKQALSKSRCLEA